jgi:outer membrane biosynthesis protein TonB
MPALTTPARDRSNRWQLPLFIVLLLGAFGGFFAVGRAGSEGASVEASGEKTEAGTVHQLSLPNVRLTGSGNLPQLAAVSKPPSPEKPKPTPPPATQTTAPAEPEVADPVQEEVPAAPVTTPTPTPTPTPAPAPTPAPSSSSGSSDGSNQPPVSFDDSG